VGADYEPAYAWSSSAASVLGTCVETPPLCGDAGSSDRLDLRPVRQRVGSLQRLPLRSCRRKSTVG
jgi:hypothetical protein